MSLLRGTALEFTLSSNQPLRLLTRPSLFEFASVSIVEVSSVLLHLSINSLMMYDLALLCVFLGLGTV